MKHWALVTYFLFISIAVFSQQKLSGLVEDDETGDPVAFATITPEKGTGFMTDSSGKFAYVTKKQPKLNDSLTISATGYSSKKVAVRDLISDNKIKIQRNSNLLEQVKVFASLKGNHQQFNYYRSFQFDTSKWVEKIDSTKYKNNERYRWNKIYHKDTRYTKNNHGNGEIGYVFDMPTKRFQLGKVQVKINHNYDTCWIKLRLRRVGTADYPLPEEDLLKKEIILPATLKYGLVEFDLNWDLIRIPTHQVYVGFELLRCGCSESTVPSFLFMGSEAGLNLYRENEKAPWKRGGDYTIYVRMITK